VQPEEANGVSSKEGRERKRHSYDANTVPKRHNYEIREKEEEREEGGYVQSPLQLLLPLPKGGLTTGLRILPLNGTTTRSQQRIQRK
jgi:hypothetical protein